MNDEMIYKISGDIDASALDDDQLDDLIDGIDEITRRDACNRNFDVTRYLSGYFDSDGNYYRLITLDGEFSESALDDFNFLLFENNLVFK